MSTNEDLKIARDSAQLDRRAAANANNMDAVRGIFVEIVALLNRLDARDTIENLSDKYVGEAVLDVLSSGIKKLKGSAAENFLANTKAARDNLNVRLSGGSVSSSQLPQSASPNPGHGSANPQFLKLSKSDWNAIFPRAPEAIIRAFALGSQHLDAAGITQTRTRLAFALANVEHECAGFTISNLTESIRYSHARIVEVFGRRWTPSKRSRLELIFNKDNVSVADVKARYGSSRGWRQRAFDDLYGGRMGNRSGTDDGSRYIGRGGPQITGRDGYMQVGKRCGINLVRHPELASLPENQPAILAAFWSWKKLNRYADKGDFKGCVRVWNGGGNGMSDRKQKLKGNDPIIRRLSSVASVLPNIDRV